MKFISADLLNRANLSYIPANMPGSQMMSNLNYIPAKIGHTYEKMSYIPAGNPPQMSFNIKNDFKEFKLSWWEANSFYNYKYILISAYYGMKWIDNFREFFNMPDDLVVIGDSGGFQNMTQDAKLNPLDVLRWQEKHCNIGLIFDNPIFLNDTTAIKRQKQDQTVLNAKMAIEKRINQNLKLYAIIQGHSIEEQAYIIKKYDALCSLDKFDGIAIGGLVPIAGDIEALIKILSLFCYNVKQYNKPVHFFGLSGNKVIPYIKYISEKFNIQITFDSSSFGAGAIRREFWLGNGNEKIDIPRYNEETIPCECPVCSKVKLVSELKKEGSIPGGLISLHNLWQTLQYVEQTRTADIYKSLNQKYLKFIDIMVKYGPEKAFQLLDPIVHNPYNQKSLFNFR